MQNNKSVRILFIIVAVIAFGLILFALTTYSVKQNESALVLRFGKVQASVSEPGLHIKAPFIDSVTKVYRGQVPYDIPTSDVITSDKKSMIADDFVIWSVTDVTKYYQTLGAVKGRAEERIDAAVYNATKNTISSLTQDEVIAARGTALTDMITKESNTDIAKYGIQINVAEIKALDLPDDNKEAVYERMISERNNIAAGYKAQGEAEAQKIKNETDKQVAITTANADAEAAKIIAEGEAEYMKILSAAYNDEGKAEFYNFLRGLDSLDAFKSDNKTLILDKDSEYARLLYGYAD